MSDDKINPETGVEENGPVDEATETQVKNIMRAAKAYERGILNMLQQEVKTCLNCANYLDHGCAVGRMEELEGDHTNDYCGNWCKERVFYVNAYEVTRNYGGPEEGGWWYNLHIPIASIPVFASSRNDSRIKGVEKSLKALFKDRSYGDIYSMKGGQELGIYVENKFAELYPKMKPHYE